MLACLYDVHGNLAALEAVLADARRRGATRFVLGGDNALFGPWPAEAVARLRELDGAVWIRGNTERWLAAPGEAPEPVRPAIAACMEALGDETVREIADTHFSAVIGSDRFCHASMANDMDSFFPVPADTEESLLLGVSEPRLVFGHTHLQFRRISAFGGIELVNPGSIGMPCDGDHRAAYAMIAGDRSLELHRVDYDWEAAVADLRANFDGDWVELPSKRLEQARFDV